MSTLLTGYCCRVFKDAAPFPGAKVYFYEVGTTTLKRIWNSADLDVEHANPATADANGEIEVHLDHGVYTLAAYTAAIPGGALIKSVDGISTPSESQYGNASDLEIAGGVDDEIVDWTAPWGDPVRYGADMTGNADSAAALVAAAASGHVVHVREGILRVDSLVNFPTNTYLIGAGGKAFSNPKTTIRLTGTGAFAIAGEVGPDVLNPIDPRLDSLFRGFQLLDDGTSATTLFDMEALSHFTLDDIAIEGAASANIGLDIHNCHHGFVTDLWVRSCLTHNIRLRVNNDAADNLFSGQTTFIRCRTFGCTSGAAGRGVKLENPFNSLAQITFIDLHAHGNDYGVDLTDSGAVTLITPHLENNLVKGLMTATSSDNKDPTIIEPFVNVDTASAIGIEFNGTGGKVIGGKFINFVATGKGIVLAGTGATVDGAYFRGEAGVSHTCIEISGDENRIDNIVLRRGVVAGWTNPIVVSGDFNRLGKVIRSNVIGPTVSSTGDGNTYSDAIICRTVVFDLAVAAAQQDFFNHQGIRGNINRIRAHVKTATGTGTATISCGIVGTGTKFLNAVTIANSQAVGTVLDLSSSIALDNFLAFGDVLVVSCAGDNVTPDAGTLIVEVEIVPYAAQR